MAIARTAMVTKLGDKAGDVAKFLIQKGIARLLAKQALELAEAQGAFTILLYG